MPMSQAVTAASSTYDPTLVGMSYVIAVFGSLTGLHSARRVRGRSGRTAVGWLLAAAISIGGGAVWSMHFIGMLAYQSDVQFGFDTTRTLVSLVVSVLASGAGLYVASRGEPTTLRIVSGGIITGLGVCAMHYLGMSAMRMNADLTYKPEIVLASVGIAVVAASAALMFAFTLTKTWAMVAAAFVMGIAVCGMHYTAMAAVVIMPNHQMSAVSGTNALSLALPVSGISSVLLFVLLFIALFEDADERDLFAAAR